MAERLYDGGSTCKNQTLRDKPRYKRLRYGLEGREVVARPAAGAGGFSKRPHYFGVHPPSNTRGMGLLSWGGKVTVVRARPLTSIPWVGHNWMEL